MATTLLKENNRVFFPSDNINIFPCSRRGQYEEKLNEEPKLTPAYYDPEARLNTERTNRLHTAINGFKDDFIVSYEEKNKKLIFVLKGYYIEVKDFEAAVIATALKTESTGEPKQIYAHLSLHAGISLNVKDYATEILYRQSTKNTKIKYLDVSYPVVDVDRQSINKDFFVGVSFTADQSAEDTVTEGVGKVIPYFLPLFSKDNKNEWQLVQTSLLPRVEHGEEENLVKIPGDLTVDSNLTVSSIAYLNTVDVKQKLIVPEIVASTSIDTPKLTATDITAKSIKANTAAELDIEATKIIADKITHNGKAVPAITLKTLENPTRYQLQIELDASKN